MAVYQARLRLKVIEGYLKRQVKKFFKHLVKIRIYQVEVIEELPGIIKTEIGGPFKTLEFNVEKDGKGYTVTFQYETDSQLKGTSSVKFEGMLDYRSEKWIKRIEKEVYYVKVFSAFSNFEPIRLEFEFSPQKIGDFKQTKYYKGGERAFDKGF